MSKKRSWLDTTHPAYDEQKEEWIVNERRMRGGRAVLNELTPFDWESVLGLHGADFLKDGAGRDVIPVIANLTDTPGITTRRGLWGHGEHYGLRQQNATYLNFPDRFASIMAGHLMRNSPQVGQGLNFGTLGEVRRKKEIDTPTAAELFYYNTDGVGVDGSEWRTYWLHVLKGAIACGVRWVFVEGPAREPRNQAEWQQGFRPYLTDYSPLAVRNWVYENGQLKMAIIHRRIRRLSLRDDQLEGNEGKLQKMLLTADGFQGLGSKFSNAGWYLFDEENEMTSFGFYEDTEGRIPLVPLYYERVRSENETRAFCRSGVFELGQAAVAYMNLSSAADFDAQDAAASVTAVRGVDDEGFNLFIAKIREGNRFAPLPPHKDSQTQSPPEVQDITTGAIAADVFDKRLKAKREEAEELMLNELQAAPYASGASKQMTFADAKEPRLAVLASEIQTVQNATIHFAEQVWGTANPVPMGSVEWPEAFSLERPTSEIREFFQTVKESGMRSKTAEIRAMLLMARRLGLVGDDEGRRQIEQELEQSAELVVEEREAEIERAKPLPPARTGA